MNENHFDFEAKQVRFLGPQVGDVESVFTGKIAKSFLKHGIKCRAYLVKVDYDDGTGVNVALCILLGESTDSNMVEELVGSTFYSMFKQSEHLDTYMISNKRDIELRGIVEPFYDTI